MLHAFRPPQTPQCHVELATSCAAQDLEGEFVNQVVSKQDIREGRARLLLDEDGSAMVPRPEGLIDEEDDWEELQQLQGLGQGERVRGLCVMLCCMDLCVV